MDNSAARMVLIDFTFYHQGGITLYSGRLQRLAITN